MAYSERTKVTGKIKDFYPDSVASTDVLGEASIDVKGSLKVRGAVLTDEGTFRVNFANSSLAVSIGTCSFTNGSTLVTGTALDTYDLKVGDYIKLDAHAESALAQIYAFNTTTITLASNYTGATASGASSRQLVKSTTGTGMTITVASGAATIAANTTAAVTSSIRRKVDVAPLIFRTAFSLSQRIANQTITAGLEDDNSTVKWYARFSFDGVTNTTVKCQTARNPTVAPTGNEIQETTITLPNGLTTATSNEYKVELLTERVNFLVNNVIVAQHTRVLPGQYDVLNAGVSVINGTTPASNTNIVVDYITCKNHNKLELGVYSDNEQIIAAQAPAEVFNYSVAGVITINTDLLIIDCSRYRSLSVQCSSMGTTGVVTPAWSNDGATYVASSIYTSLGAAAATFNAAGLWTTPVFARYLRLRLTTATTAGTTTLIVNGFQIPIGAQPVGQGTAANLNATVTATNLSTNIAQIGATTVVNGGVAGVLAVGGNVAHSAAATANPIQVGGRVLPNTAATADLSTLPGEVSYLPITGAQQLVIKPFSTTELDFTSVFSTVGTTVTLQSIAAASGTASVRNYISSIALQTDTLGAAGVAWLLDGQGAIGTSVTIATPGVFTSSAHDLKIGDAIVFTSLGTITGVSTNTVYYINATSFTATTFTVSTTIGGTALQITGSTAAFTFYRVLYQLRLQTTSINGISQVVFQTPIRAMANVVTNFLIPTSLTSGSVYLTLNGYRGF